MIKALTLAASLAFLASLALAEPTHVMVRAQAHRSIDATDAALGIGGGFFAKRHPLTPSAS